jgi:hypothetical protein
VRAFVIQREHMAIGATKYGNVAFTVSALHDARTSAGNVFQWDDFDPVTHILLSIHTHGRGTSSTTALGLFKSQ